MKKILLFFVLGAMTTAMVSCNKSVKPLPADQKVVETAEPTPAAPAAAAAPDFTLNDINGNPLSLSSLKGKPVVLDFWGSWCGWCVKGVPQMKKYYEKYKGKFEILGIDCNEDEASWKKAVKELALPWLHVYCPKESTLLSDYGIQGFPTKIVVDADGNIMKIVIGEDPEFYTYLDEVFSK